MKKALQKKMNFPQKRAKESTNPKNNALDEFYSDKSRIIYSSSFRRLMQKAQVFSLEINSNVRTRLIHSIEVADIGRTLANSIGKKLLEKELIEENEIPAMVAIVENACLLHDIGNPPFAHFGESAIRRWSEENLSLIAAELGLEGMQDFNNLKQDFLQFDGNPQGFRIASKLHCERDKYSLNLTHATLLSLIKYPRSTKERKSAGIYKKAGYFQSEADFVKTIYESNNLSLGTRYPLVYIMEAADDIAYCLSDIADGIEKKIITKDEFVKYFKEMWVKDFSNLPCPVKDIDSNLPFSMSIAAPWCQFFISEIANVFVDNYDFIISGEKKNFLISDTNSEKVLNTIKKVTREHIYTAPEAEHIELSGYAVVFGLLNKFGLLLELDSCDFEKLVKKETISKNKNYDIEKRLINHIGKKCIKRYIIDIEEIKDSDEYELYEWFLRTHLIVDHISGMADSYALATYQMLSGIKTSFN